MLQYTIFAPFCIVQPFFFLLFPVVLMIDKRLSIG